MPRWAHPPFTLLTLLPAVLLCLAAGAHAQQGSVATDTAALQALYNSTDGANWTDNTNWTSDMALSTWHGVTTNGDGRVTRLELQENGLNGTLPTELENLTHLESLLLDRNYALMGPLPDGLRELLALATVDLTDTELCAPEDAAFQDWTATISSFSGLTRAPTEESVIDVAVFYTPQAREAQDGHDQIKAKIDLMVAETNRAYTDSGVDQRINPVVVEEVAYTETSLLTDIVRLKGPSDGHMDEVHAIRDRVWADIVMLIRARGGGQAVAMLTESTNHARNAFGVCGAHTGVFAHELGHIMGLKHDRYEECDASRCNSALSADAYGYVNQRAFDENAPASSRWRTIMAYDSQCDRDGFNCQSLLRFSNPNQLYPDADGDPLGVALTSDNEDSIAVDGPANAVRVLNETRDTVADFRQGRAVKVFFDAGPYSVTEGGTVTVTVRLDAAPGRTLNIPIPLTANSLDGAWAGDYAMPSSIIFGSNQTEQTFTVTAVNDTVQEAEETVTLGFGEPLPAGVTVGSQATATVTLTDNDTVPGVPSVAEIAITSEPGPAYAAGEEVEVTVIFTRPVTVTGTPGLGLTIGTTTRPMVYQGARSASEVLVFAYTVADGESDTDGVSIPENSLAGTIRDSANQDAAMLTHAAVDADHTVDGVTPELDAAVADGTVVTLTYGEALDESSTPATDVFTVTVAGSRRTVTHVSVSGRAVTLTLASAVTDGQEVTVTYTVPGTNPIRDAAGNAAEGLSNDPVRNATRDTTPPTISIVLSPGHGVPLNMAITATVTLDNLDPASYSSLVFRADLTEWDQAFARSIHCEGKDTSKDITVEVDASRETITVEVWKSCSQDIYAYFTLDAALFRLDTSAPGGRVELASAETRFAMSRYLQAGQTAPPPPAPGVAAWLDPDPTSFEWKVGESVVFRARTDILQYLNHHLGVRGFGSEDGARFADDTNGLDAEEACRNVDDGIVDWRRAIHQPVRFFACRAGEATIEVWHETEAERLSTYEFRIRPADDDEVAAPVITTISPILVPENETAVATLNATDDDTPIDQLTWTIPSGTNGGADADHFTLIEAGALAFAAAKDYEIPDDADGDRTYEVTVQVSDDDNSVTADLLVTLENVLELTPLTGPAMVDYAENKALRVAAYIASSEEDREGLDWILSGADANRFSIGNPGGVLRFDIDPIAPDVFLQPPDFEDRPTPIPTMSTR